MKQVTCVRHGDALPWPSGGSDFDRRLSEHGELQVARLAVALRGRKFQPEFVLASAAPRALRTAELLCEGLQLPPAALHPDRCFYEHGLEAALEQLWGLREELHSVLLVAHHPTMSALPAWLTGTGLDALGTAEAVSVELAIGRWQEAQAGCGTLLWRIGPPGEL
ncbi:MAG: hypothetical protein A2284_05255 [Deltaproteobacteria bacterium RIFOXYA12_FULL_61_11]|nr:MAG: hypothetical protein A2284_05255 [Deltaproteobacteria bacterium RIFOXYA12_FULL_61_11]